MQRASPRIVRLDLPKILCGIIRLQPGCRQRVITRMNNDVTNRVKAIQAVMVESAKSCFDESEIDHLRYVIELTVEFRHYLEYGSTEMARGLQEGAYAEYFEDLKSASVDPFNKYDLGCVCRSIRSGVDSFCGLNATYRILVGATGSKVEWHMISPRDSFKAQFISMFNEFTEETEFENKCRLLLDLFKLQIVFAGVSYE